MLILSRRLGSAGFAVAITAALTTLTPEAHANSDLDNKVRSGIESVVGLLAAGAFGIVNVGLSLPDFVYAVEGERQPKPLAITKIVICAPQALIYHGFTFSFAGSNTDEEITLLTTFMGAWTASMTTSAIWSRASDIDPASLYGISWAVGANSAFMAATLGQLFGENPMKSRAFGIAEMVSMVPTITVSTIRLTDPTAARPAWATLAGWSGLLFAHGLVTAVRTEKDSKSSERQGKKIDFPRFHFGPTLVSDGVRQVPGLMFAGKF